MRKLLVALGILFIPFLSSAQKEAYNWVFGNNIKLDFSTSPPTFTALTFGNNTTPNVGYNVESSTSVSDASGQLLFYSTGQYLYNGWTNSNISSSLKTTLDACQGNLVIPKPGTTDQYLLFTVDAVNTGTCGGVGESGSNRGANYYSVTVNSGAQTVSVSGSTAVPGAPTTVIEGQAACPTSVTDEYWYVVHEVGNNTFKVYKVNSSGVTFDHDNSVGPTFSGCSYINIKFNSCYTQMAVAMPGTTNNVTVYDFNVTTGAISNPQTISVSGAYGLEFSPLDASGNSYLYISQNEVTPAQIYRASINSTGTVSAPVAFASLNGNSNGGSGDIDKTGHLQLGPDGNIYVADKLSYNNLNGTVKNYVGCILNPETSGATFNSKYITINDNNYGNQYLHVGMGLPTFLKSLVSSVVNVTIGSVNIDDEYICEGDSPAMSLTVVGGYQGTPTWTFTPPSGSVQTFNGTSATPNFSVAGTWELDLSVKDACGRLKTVSKTLTVYAKITPDFTYSCSGGVVNITGTTGTGGTPANYVYYNNSTGAYIGSGSTSSYSGSLPVDIRVEDMSPLSSGGGPYNVSNGAYSWGSGSTLTNKTGFDVLANEVFIKSVVVYPDPFAGAFNGQTVKFLIKNSGGTTVGSISYTFPSTTSAQTVPVDLLLPSGTGYTFELDPTSSWKLFKTGNKPSSPVVQSGVFSFNGDPSVSNPDNSSKGSGPVSSFNIVVPYPCRNSTTKTGITCCTKPNITSSATGKVCSGSAQSYSITSDIGGTTYSWKRDAVSGISNGAVNGQTSSTITETLVNTTSSPVVVTYVIIPTAAGCTGNSFSYNVTVNPKPTVTATASPSATVCSGTKVTLKGGGASTYSWDNGVTDNSQFTPATTKTYTLTGTDANGCTNTTTETITVNANPTVTATSTPASGVVCSGTQVTLKGGGALTYTWDNSVTDNSPFTPTTTKTYTVTGIDGNNCTNTKQITITVNPIPTVTATSSPASGVVCSGTQVTLKGGGALTYTWDNSVTDNSPFTPTTTKTYTVTGTDGNNCTNTKQITITVNPIPTVTATSIPASGVVCSGIQVTLKGGGANSYTWDNGITDNTPFTPSTTTTYTVTGTDGNNCTNTKQITITVNPKAIIQTQPQDQGTCSGGNVTLSLTLDPSFSATPFYQWQTNSSGSWTDISGATTNPYSYGPISASSQYRAIISAGTLGSCPDTSSVANITVSTNTSIGTFTSDKNLCVGNSLSLSVSANGSAPFTYKWYKVQNGTTTVVQNTVTVSATSDNYNVASVAVADSGTYYVEVTSGCGTVTTSNTKVTVGDVPAQPSNISGSNTVCTGTTQAYSVTSVSGVTYSWILTGGGTLTPSTTASTSVDWTSMGPYTIKVTPQNSCGSGNPSTLNITVSSGTSASAGSITGSQNVCVGNQTYSVAPQSGISYLWELTSSPQGGAITSGANTESASVSWSSTGTFDLKVTPSNTCGAGTPSTISVMVNDVPAQPSAITGSTSVCVEDQTYSVTNVSGVTYDWAVSGGGPVSPSGSSATVSWSTPGNYTITVTPSNSCGTAVQPSTLNVTVNGVTITSQPSNASACPGTDAQFTVQATGVSGSLSYEWLVDGTGSFIDVTTGVSGNGTSTLTVNNVTASMDGYQYKVIIKDGSCSLTSNSGTLNVGSGTTVTTQHVDTTICEGNPLTLSVSTSGASPTNIQWYHDGNPVGTPGSNTYPIPSGTSADAGEYTVEIQSSCGTSTKSIATVAVTPTIQTNNSVSGQDVCEGTDANVIISSSQTGVYYQAYIGSFSLTSPEGGNNGDLTIAISKDFLSSGSNTITVKASSSCGTVSLTNSATINVLGNAGSISGKTTVCANDASQTYSIDPVPGASSYIWTINNGVPTTTTTTTPDIITNIGSGTTTISVVPSNGSSTTCGSSGTYTVTQIPAYTPESLVADQTTVCAGSEITFTIQNPGSGTGYNWSFPSGSHQMNQTNTSRTERFDTPGDYTVSLQPVNACQTNISPLTVDISILDVPVADAGTDISLTDYQPVTLDGSGSSQGSNYSYTWTSSDASVIIQDPNNITTQATTKSLYTEFTLTVSTTNSANCSASDVVAVSVELKVKIPNVFSPNGDGQHDYFLIPNAVYFPNSILYVYNQWGERIYKSAPGYPSPWDGNRDGSPVDIGAYYYIYEFNQAGYKSISGSVTIVR